MQYAFRFTDNRIPFEKCDEAEKLRRLDVVKTCLEQGCDTKFMSNVSAVPVDVIYEELLHVSNDFPQE